MTIFRKVYEDVHEFRKIVISLVVICLFVGIACYCFYDQVRQTAHDESEHYLREISNRINSNIERTIKDNFSILETMKGVLEKMDGQSHGNIGTFLHDQENHWSFNKALLIDNSGIAYDFAGEEVSITGDSFLRTLSYEKNTIAPTQIINNEETLIFATPLSNIMVDGKEMVALATCYDPENFDQILSMSSFNDEAYSYIVNKIGKGVIRSSSTYADEFGYNIIHTLQDENPRDKDEISALLENMKQDKNGQYEVSVDNVDKYLIYTKIGMEDWYLFTFVPVQAVSAQSNMLLRSTLAISALVFLVFFIFLIIIIFSFSRNKRRLEQLAYVDPLTKGFTIQKFNEVANQRLSEDDSDMALLYINVERFKILNAQLGRAICDQIILSIHHGLASKLHDNEFIGHRTADNFIMLVDFHNKEELSSRLYEWNQCIEDTIRKYMDTLPLFNMEYGIYIVDNHEIPLEDMIDSAKVALKDNMVIHAKNDYIHYAFYDDATRARMLKEKYLEDQMERALKENEFKMYLQPKYNVKSNTIGGAEALVRWQGKDGMIYPDEFIPLFEKNGFVVKVDLWMFEQVCKLLQNWMDEGKPLIKISVNCSRAHLKDPDFLNAYEEIYKKYRVPSEYLELEFTENMALEDTNLLTRLIDKIHDLGFECSMDDFGSGYSSLNLLQEIHVDTLKLDRIFFKHAFEDDVRTTAIINCVLKMAQSLDMVTVAEGIEEWPQVEILKDMGCDYIQGYVYAKPMPVKEFEQLINENGEQAEENK